MIRKGIATHYTLGKQERLKSRKLIAELFNSGKASGAPPLRALYLVKQEGLPLQAGFTVSSKNFKRAVDRNRIKRLMREAYRLNKHILQNELVAKQKMATLFFIYTGRELPDHELIVTKMLTLIQSISKEIAAAE